MSEVLSLNLEIENYTQSIIDTANKIILIANHKEPVHIAGFKKL